MIQKELLGLLRHRDLIRELVIRGLKVRYRRSAVGFLWTMLHPLMMMLVLTTVFSHVFHLEHYGLHVLAGVIFWQFFSQTVTSCLYSLRGNASLLTKLPLPKSVFPLSTVLSGLLNLVFALVPLLVIAVISGDHPLSAALVFLPVSIAVAGIFTLGVGLLLAPLAVIFSDTIEVVSILLTLVMYLTPVFYPEEIIPEHLRWVVALNPLAAMLGIFRAPLVAHTLPSLSTLLFASASAAGLLIVGVVVFTSTSRRLALYL